MVVKYPEMPELGLIASTMGLDGIHSLWSQSQIDSTDFLSRMLQAIQSQDPAWAKCEPDLQGVWDPPTALQPAPAAATLTVTVAPPSSLASPLRLLPTVMPTQTPVGGPSRSTEGEEGWIIKTLRAWSRN